MKWTNKWLGLCNNYWVWSGSWFSEWRFCADIARARFFSLENFNYFKTNPGGTRRTSSVKRTAALMESAAVWTSASGNGGSVRRAECNLAVDTRIRYGQCLLNWKIVCEQVLLTVWCMMGLKKSRKVNELDPWIKKCLNFRLFLEPIKSLQNQKYILLVTEVNCHRPLQI